MSAVYRRVVWWVLFWAMLAWWVFLAMFMTLQTVRAECRPYPVGPNSPTGIYGCETYGEGIASWYTGPGAARNDCIWPWTDCKPISIQSLQTGVTIIVTPVMWCDCYTGTANERLVDLTPDLVQALGLDLSQGLYPVIVASATGSSGGSTVPPLSSGPVLALPDTAMR